jgi:hypothetical protein
VHNIESDNRLMVSEGHDQVTEMSSKSKAFTSGAGIINDFRSTKDTNFFKESS